jgi:hypothetical protein
MNELGKQLRTLCTLAVAFCLMSEMRAASQTPDAPSRVAPQATGERDGLPAGKQDLAPAEPYNPLRADAPELSLRARPVPQQPPEIPDNPNLTSTLVFGAGTFFINNAATQASLESSSGVGAIVDFENVLGLQKESWVPFFYGRWRTSERWRVEAEYFNLNRSGFKVLGQDVTWHGQTFPAGSSVDCKFDFADVRVSVGYSFYKTQDKELGIALGAHVADVNAEIAASGVSGIAGKVLAPLPVVSLFGGFAMTDQWAVAARFDAFSLTYDPYHGHLYDLGLDLLWNPWRHIGFGAGFRSLQMQGGVSSSKFTGDIDVSFSGPVVYMTAAF